MAQVTDERLAELIAWEEADIPDYQAVNDEAGARCVKDSLDLIVALRELQQARAKLAGVEAGTQIKRFTAYRRNISQRETHNELQKNPDDQPQYEGVIFTDGSVALRWRTAIHCTSVWSSLQDALSIHGHPEYGSEIIWHDGDTPPEWRAMLSAADSKEGK